MPVNPFPFQDLPKVSRGENQLVGTLQSFWQESGFSQTFVPSLEQLISKTLGVNCTISLERLFTDQSERFLASLPPSGAYLLFGLTPLTQKMVMELDLILAHAIIDRLLGGTGEPMGAVGPLSEVEEGILSYFVLKVLAHLHERVGEGGKLHFRLEELAPSCQRWKESFKGSHSVILFVGVTLGHRRGYGKLVIPAVLLQKGFLEAFNHVTREQPVALSEPELLDRFGWVESKLLAEIGETTLRSREIQGLAKGDVVFFDKTRISLREGRAEGEVSLRMGKKGRRARIISAGKHIEVELL